MTRRDKLINEIVEKITGLILYETVDDNARLKASKFSNWKIPNLSQLKLEFKIEHEYKERSDFRNEEEFLTAVQNGKIKTLTVADDHKIGGRSNTENKEELLDLVSSYASWPEFRNEKTVQAIYDGFLENRPMDLPIVLVDSRGNRDIFSGNTRLDVAFQLGVTPKVLEVKSNFWEIHAENSRHYE